MRYNRKTFTTITNKFPYNANITNILNLILPFSVRSFLTCDFNFFYIELVRLTTI